MSACVKTFSSSHGASDNACSSARPSGRHNAFLRRRPSLSATTCNWFITRVRICTRRCRCHSSCPQIAILRIRYPDARKAVLQHQLQYELRILPIGLLLAHPLRADLGSVADPQLELQIVQQTLEPARVSAGFHAYPHDLAVLAHFAVELLGFFRVFQPALTHFARVGAYESNLLEARVIVTTYNDHLRLLSPEPVGWLSTTNLLGPGSRHCLWNHFTHYRVNA